MDFALDPFFVFFEGLGGFGWSKGSFFSVSRALTIRTGANHADYGPDNEKTEQSRTGLVHTSQYEQLPKQ